MAAHRHWQIYVTSPNGGGNDFGLSELEFMESVGGADVTGSGTASGTGGVPADAFDNNTGTEFQSFTFGGGARELSYDFGSGNDKDILEVAITALATPSNEPLDFEIRHSDDGTSWTSIKAYTGESGWTSLQRRTFGTSAITAVNEVITESIESRMGLGSVGDTVSKYGGHRYFKIVVTQSETPTLVQLASLGVAETAGGPYNFEMEGYTATASSESAGFEAPNAFTSVSWASLGGNAMPQEWVLDFGVGDERDIKEITLNEAGTSNSPEAFSLHYSDDNVTWSQTGEFTTEWLGGYLSQEVFTLGVINVFLVEGLTLDDLEYIGTIYPELAASSLSTADTLGSSSEAVSSVIEDLQATSTILHGLINAIIENVDVNSSLITSAALNNLIEESTRVSSLIKLGFFLSIIDSVNTSSSTELTKKLSGNVEEFTSAVLEIVTQVVGNDKVEEVIEASDFQELPLLALINEIITGNDSLLPSLIAKEVLNDASGFSDSVIENLLLNLTLKDTIDFSSGASLSSILFSKIEDVITFTLKDFDDTSGYYGWTYSPESSAVTNYSLDFSEVTEYGGEYYLGGPSGLFMLGGNLDQNDFIQSRITTAGLSFGAKTEKQIPEVFLGVDGDNIVISVSVDKQETVYYNLVSSGTDPLRTKRLKIGKGLIGNTWQFSLIDKDSEEFNLNSLEFYPVTLKRKHR
jgi:hypothetical protein